MNDQYIDNSCLRKYRTEIPNIVFDIGLHPLSLAIYCYIKRRAGAYTKDICNESSTSVAKNLGMTKPTFIKYRGFLEKTHQKLNGKSLISIECMKSNDDGDKPNRITIVDIWPENFIKLSKPKIKKISGE